MDSSEIRVRQLPFDTSFFNGDYVLTQNNLTSNCRVCFLCVNDIGVFLIVDELKRSEDGLSDILSCIIVMCTAHTNDNILFIFVRRLCLDSIYVANPGVEACSQICQ